MLMKCQSFCFVLYLILGINSLLLQAQHPYAWDLTVEDGLPSLEVYDLYEDSKGYMWMGTDKGVCRYNGQEFKSYYNEVQRKEAISGMQEDAKGRIWCRSFDGQVFYIEDDSLHYFDELGKASIREFLVTKDGSLCILDPGKRTVYFFSEEGGEWTKKVLNGIKLDPKSGMVMPEFTI